LGLKSFAGVFVDNEKYLFVFPVHDYPIDQQVNLTWEMVEG